MACVFQANLKVFMSHVRRNETEQVVKLCNRGLDPNFHEHETGGKSRDRAAQVVKLCNRGLDPNFHEHVTGG